LEQAEVRHGQEIRADLPGIKVSASARAWLGSRQSDKGEVFFCSMGPIRLRSVTIGGDGKALPNEAVVQGLNVSAEGTYDLVNALVRSNGDLRVIVDEVTEVVRTDARGACAAAHQFLCCLSRSRADSSRPEWRDQSRVSPTPQRRRGVPCRRLIRDSTRPAALALMNRTAASRLGMEAGAPKAKP
jgi:hypothetical protein